jgi:uncharacterized protein YidB (DUF937 family)
MDKLFGGASGGLGGLESMLGGVAGGGASSLLPAVMGMIGGEGGAVTGLEKLVGSLESGGLGEIVGSWVGMGPNKAITPEQVKKGLGNDTIANLAKQSGLPVGDVVQHLTTILPSLVNNLTPDGKLPDAASLAKSLGGLQGLLKG